MSSPGSYQLLITADDGKGGISEAVAKVTVTAAAAVKQSPPLPVQLTAPSIYGGKLASSPQLPTRTFYQGAVMEVDAAVSGIFNLSSPNWRAGVSSAACVWTLTGSGAGASATVYGCSMPARFRLSTVGSFKLTLQVTLKGASKPQSRSCVVTVLTKPFWSEYYYAASPQGFPSGRCSSGYLSSVEFTPLSLSCGGVTLPLGWGADAGLDGAVQKLGFTWKLTPLTQRAAATHKQPLTRTSEAGGKASFGAAAPGLYLVEVVGAQGGAGGGSTSSVRSVYYLYGLLIVEPTAQLVVASPAAGCAGSAVKLALAAPALLPSQSAGPARWSVSWADAKAAIGSPLTLTGSGSSFSFVTQPGRYAAVMTMDVTDGGVVRRLTGKAAVEARPCFQCASSPVKLTTMTNRCSVAQQDAVKLMTAQPAWKGAAKVDFAPGSDLTPGTRALTVVASSLSTNVTTKCKVNNVS